MSEGTSIAVLARRTADTRRVLMNVFGTELGQMVTLDLMGLTSPTPEQVRFAQVIAETHRQTLARSTLFLADADMVDLLDAAAPTMPDQELQVTDFLVPDGFLYFAQPLPERSGVPPEIPIHALSWAYLGEGHPLLAERGEGKPSILITAYVAVREQFEARNLIRPGEDLAPNTPKYLPNATVVWTIGTLIGSVFGEVPPPEHGFTPGFYQRVLAAFWTLSQQPKMTSTSQERLAAKDQRKHRRSGITEPSAPVHVIRLHHKPVGSSPAVKGEPGDRRVKVRFPVRGFWRNHYFPSVKSHRHIYIEPHFRGPEDAPLVGGERVFLAHGPKQERGEPPRK